MKANYVPRYMEETLKKWTRFFPVIYLGGPRQVGKTTLLKHLGKKQKRSYVSLDTWEWRQLAKTDPALFLEQFPPPVFIDEVQYAPELFPYIKSRVDANKRPGMYWLSGSQHFSLLKGLKESLAGRVGVAFLLGLSQGEIFGIKRRREPSILKSAVASHKVVPHKKGADLFERIHRGSFPELTQKKDFPWSAFYNSYLSTYLERDVSEILSIKDASSFRRFLGLAAARTAQMLKLSELARDADISVNTAKAWLSILETCGLLYFLKAYKTNKSSGLIKAPKMYFLDTGLAAYLTKWSDAKTLAYGAMAGAFLETYVVSELVKSYLSRGLEAPLYYFRDKKNHEVDVIIESAEGLTAIEIKKSAKVTVADAQDLLFLSKKTKVNNCLILSRTKTPYRLSKDAQVLPIEGIA